MYGSKILNELKFAINVYQSKTYKIVICTNNVKIWPDACTSVCLVPWQKLRFYF